jgi:hypothetical protein
MSSEKTLDGIEACLDAETQPPTEAEHHANAEDTQSSAHEEAAEAPTVTLTDGSEPDPDLSRRLNSLDHKRRQQLNLIEAEAGKHERAVAKISEAEAAIAEAWQAERNARVELAIHHEQKDSALRHKAEAETKLREINSELHELSLSPAQRKARDTRREWERRRAEAEAEAAAAKEAHDNELLEFEQVYVPMPKTRRSDPDKWAIVAPHNRFIQVKRKDLPQYEAEHREAVEFFAREARDELAAEYEAELRTNGRPTYFASKIEHGAYLAAWGSDSIRGRAYRARQLERGLSDADPVRLGRPLPGVHVMPPEPR